MTPFADTNWLVAAYFEKRDGDRTGIVERHARKHRSFWIVSHIVLLEARNVFGRISGSPDPPEWQRLQADLGRRIYVDPMVWDLQRQRTHALFAKYSHKTNVGTFDAALVASALLGGGTVMLSFDQPLKALAAAERMEVYPDLEADGKALLAVLR
jgi:predicted nucleic acid-binding protein